MAKGSKHKRNEAAIKTLAANIRKYRLSKKLTMEDLANIIDVDYSQISRVERAIVNPNVSLIFDIARALGISPGQLLEE